MQHHSPVRAGTPRPQTPVPDPLAALGHDIFVDILHHLACHDLVAALQVCHAWTDCIQAHSVSLWRDACLHAAAEPVQLRKCQAWMAGTDVERDEFNGFVDPLALLGEPEQSGRTVNWQHLCEHCAAADSG